MSDEELYWKIRSIPDGQAASVVMLDMNPKRSFECTFKESEPPLFFLLFTPDNFPEGSAAGQNCVLMSENKKGQVINLGAKIIATRNNRILELEGTETTRPEELREYFRVNLQTTVILSVAPDPQNPSIPPVSIEGETVDISQSGILANFPEEWRSKTAVNIILDLPNPQAVVTCRAEMVRAKRVKKDKWLTAFRFVKISARDRDIIAKNCFTAQRRLLRENVQVTG